MDGPHDLGGKEGYGPIETDAPPWRAEWEHRQWALTRLLPPRAASIDAWRHGVEQVPAVPYLTLPYFGKWNLNDVALLVQAGHVSLDEMLTGEATTATEPPAAKTVDDCLDMVRASNLDFQRPAPGSPRFQLGDSVTTVARGHSGHTRLPAYARAATGTVTAHHGAHAYPDDEAKGIDAAHHLYTVAFAAPALFAEADAADTVLLDLWEPYFT